MLFLPLAQALPTSQPAGLHSAAGDYLKQWGQTLQQSPHAFLPAMMWAFATLVLGLFISYLFRQWITRWRLRFSTTALIFTTSLYVGLWTLAPSKMTDPADYVSLWLHRVFGAVFIVVLLRLVDRLVLRPMLTRGGRIPLNRFLHQLLRFIVFLYVLVLYLSTAFGYSADRLLAGSAVITIVVGLALQESLGNLFAGVVLQASNPFGLGDWIQIGDDEGRVIDMTWRAVTMLNGSNNQVMIPNSVITKQRIVNFRAPMTASGYSVKISIDPSVPPDQIIAVLSEALRETPGVLNDPAPGASLDSFAESAITYSAYFSVANPSDHWGVESRARINIWYRLHAAGIRIPYPTRTIEMIDSKVEQQQRQKAELADRFRALSTTELFKPLTEAQRLKLAQDSRTLLLAPGQVLFRKGDSGTTLYVIQQGAVDAYVPRDDGGDDVVVTLEAPEVFGEMTPMAGEPRPATVRSHGDSVLIEIEKSHLEAIFNSDKEVMAKMVEVLDAHQKAGKARLAELAKSHDPSITAEQAQQPTLFDRVRGFFTNG